MRHGPVLVVPRGCPLIGACVKCGGTPANERRLAQVAWAPPWVYATLLLSWIVTIIAYYATRKQAVHDVSLCTRCAADWDRSRGQESIAWISVFVGLSVGTVLLAAEAVAAGAAMMVGAPILGIAGAVIARRKRLRAARISNDETQLLGVDPSIQPYAALPPGQPTPYAPGYAPAPHQQPPLSPHLGPNDR